MRKPNLLRAIAFALFILGTLMVVPLASAQGCSLCYTQVANSGARMIRALRNGIVILIIPPVSMCIAAMIFTFRKRNQFYQTDGDSEGSSGW